MSARPAHATTHYYHVAASYFQAATVTHALGPTLIADISRSLCLQSRHQLLTTALAGLVMQSPPSVRLSVLLFPLCLLD